MKDRMMTLLQQLSEHLQNGDAQQVAECTRRAIDERLSPKDVLDQGLIAGMNVIGERFRNHEIFLPDVLLAAKAMYAGLDLLKPLMIRENIQGQGKVVIGTIQGDLHDIGKNLVAIMLKGAGFEVIDLGHDVSPEDFVGTAIRERADVIGMSALLTTTMPGMKTVVDLAKKNNLHERVRIIVGGAPLSAEYAKEIGADAYCYDGMNAVETVKRFLDKRS
jgi:5-methyltetrahydrofolate--homocysteine methyltransferase